MIGKMMIKHDDEMMMNEKEKLFRGATEREEAFCMIYVRSYQYD